MDAKIISWYIANRDNLFKARALTCLVPNVSWGLFSWGEADLIGLRKSGYLIEGEIKISKADFDKDKYKKKFREGSSWYNEIKEFYYIVPENLVDHVLDNTSYGVIAVTEKGRVSLKRKSPVNKEAVKLDDQTTIKLMRLGCLKYWSRYQKNS